MNILHQNIKPENILLSSDKKIKVSDYLMNKLFAENKVPDEQVLNYTSPEQLKGSPASKASDIWSLGCILYEMCYSKVISYVN